MKPDSLEQPELWVEGRTDRYTIIELLARHHIKLDQDFGPVRVKEGRNDLGVLNSMKTIIPATLSRPIGFALDANGSVKDRWSSVCDRLAKFGMKLPSQTGKEGFIGKSTSTKSRVGVWIMPNNQTDEGTLEHLIKTLVPEGDQLYQLAQSATVEALTKGAKFGPKDRLKAELHCWLGWQECPGLPFGSAVKACFFRHDSEAAIAFVDWFRRLYAEFI